MLNEHARKRTQSLLIQSIVRLSPEKGLSDFFQFKEELIRLSVNVMLLSNFETASSFKFLGTIFRPNNWLFVSQPMLKADDFLQLPLSV